MRAYTRTYTNQLIYTVHKWEQSKTKMDPLPKTLFLGHFWQNDEIFPEKLGYVSQNYIMIP